MSWLGTKKLWRGRIEAFLKRELLPLMEEEQRDADAQYILAVQRRERSRRMLALIRKLSEDFEALDLPMIDFYNTTLKRLQQERVQKDMTDED